MCSPSREVSLLATDCEWYNQEPYRQKIFGTLLGVPFFIMKRISIICWYWGNIKSIRLITWRSSVQIWLPQPIFTKQYQHLTRLLWEVFCVGETRGATTVLLLEMHRLRAPNAFAKSRHLFGLQQLQGTSCFLCEWLVFIWINGLERSKDARNALPLATIDIGALSEQNCLRRAGWAISVSRWQNTALFATSRRAPRSSVWPWWCMSVSRYRFGMWRICCTNAGSTSAMRRFDFGGTDLARCLPLRSARKGSARCAHIQIGSSTWMRCSWRSTAKPLSLAGYGSWMGSSGMLRQKAPLSQSNLQIT